MFDEQNRFLIRDYASRAPFSSFLPGIAGELGIPVWCYYSNRGQGVCSFGVRDKDHAIMEFSPAHVAYRDVGRTGFRTFCKIDGKYLELFTEESDMHIGMSELEITCRQSGLSASALYFGVPEERTACLARILTIENTTSQPMELELLDGIPAMVPYGLNQDFLKNMTQLSKAWMQAEDHEHGNAYFRVRASLEDSAIVREVKGGNFCLGWDETGTLLHPIVQPGLIFGQDSSLFAACRFRKTPLGDTVKLKQITSNQFLCCFLPKIISLQPGAFCVIRSLYGQADSKDAVVALARNAGTNGWFDNKRIKAQILVDNLTSPIRCKTADPVFDAYARQTYLDNALRGGAPIFFRHEGKSVSFHIYSRKHGDPEREYNYFSLGQEYYAQGNGNYRDVNQNRRCDVLFSPEIGDLNIRTFFDLIQSDGYNPLVLTPCTYTLPAEKQIDFIREYPDLQRLLSGEFTPGQIAMAAEDAGYPDPAGITARIICESENEPNADFGEGYWCDHWTYNLDQIETYLTIYPERKDELLFAEDTCRWYDTRVLINPRRKRYRMTENGLRQYYALDETAKISHYKWMRTSDGMTARSSIMEKILLLCGLKTATLDPEGMGIEMEGGRPGWYDALNGLPGLLGSSMAESCELARLLSFAAQTLESKDGSLSLYSEIWDVLKTVGHTLETEADPFTRWDAMNTFKEQYRAQTCNGFCGTKLQIPCRDLAILIHKIEQEVLDGIEKAKERNSGLIPTYFTFSAENAEGWKPLKLTATPLPLFLEGPVRYLKLPLSHDEKKVLSGRVKESCLYDRKLRMYKVNESLSGVSFEAGRAMAFTPGWLENESVWLHMEYKYLLELLKSGLYEEFSQAFHDAAIPFLNPDIYGRSTLENVSFLASSANPDPEIHGRGFVSRLSGSTAEFIHMWQVLFFGLQPFRLHEGKLTLEFSPFLPEYLMAPEIHAVFLGSVHVTYLCDGLSALIPGYTKAQSHLLTYRDGTQKAFTGSTLEEGPSLDIRNGLVKRILVTMR